MFFSLFQIHPDPDTFVFALVADYKNFMKLWDQRKKIFLCLIEPKILITHKVWMNTFGDFNKVRNQIFNDNNLNCWFLVILTDILCISYHFPGAIRRRFSSIIVVFSVCQMTSCTLPFNHWSLGSILCCSSLPVSDNTCKTNATTDTPRCPELSCRGHFEIICDIHMGDVADVQTCL